jgi:hypothetical protein
MTIQVSLHDGTVLKAEMENYDAESIEGKMNDPKILALRIGNAVLNKNIIKYIAPVQV